MTDPTDTLATLYPSTTIGEAFDIPAAIYRAYQEGKVGPLTINLQGSQRTPRTYLGGSRIGLECERRVWCEYRGLAQEDFPGRILRLFKTGDIGEVRVRHELRAIGLEVGGDQARFEALNGRVAGHTDGFVRAPGTDWMLFECKTAGKNSYGKYKRYVRQWRHEGEERHPLKRWKSEYFYQIQLYMERFGLTHTLYAVVEKDTDELLVEVYELDPSEAEWAKERGARVVTSDEMPDGYAAPRRPTCTWCPMMGFCHEDEALPVKCGSCKHWTSEAGGYGRCTLHDAHVTQHEVCEQYEAIEEPDGFDVFMWSD